MVRMICEADKVEAEADVDVLLRKVVTVDQHLAYLIGGIGVFSFVRVEILKKELPIALLYDAFGVRLNFFHHAEYFSDLGIECNLGAEEDVAIGVGGFVAVIDQFGVSTDLAIVAGDQFEKAQNAMLVHDAEDEGRGRLQKIFLDVPAEADETFLEVTPPSLPDLPYIEIDKAHGEHVVGEEGELELAVGVVGIEDVPQKGDVVLLAGRLEGKWQIVAEFGSFFHGSFLRRGWLVLTPNACEGGLDLLLEARDQFAVGCNQGLLGFDLGDNGLLHGEGWEGDFEFLQLLNRQRFVCSTKHNMVDAFDES